MLDHVVAIDRLSGLGQSGICWGKTESRAILKAANAQNTNVNIGWKLELVPVGSTVRYEILKLCSGLL